MRDRLLDRQHDVPRILVEDPAVKGLRLHAFVKLASVQKVLGIGAAQSYRVHEVVSDRWYDWRGARNYVELDPTLEPAQVFVLHR
jgi:hypothetical protein